MLAKIAETLAKDWSGDEAILGAVLGPCIKICEILTNKQNDARVVLETIYGTFVVFSNINTNTSTVEIGNQETMRSKLTSIEKQRLNQVWEVSK